MTSDNHTTSKSISDKRVVEALTPFPPSVVFTDARRLEFWNAPRVRETFLKYFAEACGHTFVPSSSTIPHDDPTLLFANSGMTQFKPIFQGIIDPSAPMARLRRAANSQKCIRAGGKHNDLEDVGKDVYHHTFFEMLGNWSFGDYFKAEAIGMAWELLTVVYGLPKERLYVTYFGGDPRYGLPSDEEARQLWIAAGVPSERVLPFGMKENFWEMGESGPCGPCSEIHFDRIGGGRDAAHLVNADDPDVLEIWNLVFMQFNREADGSLKSLPNKHVDTGMGFERVLSVLQNKRSNYDTDVFMPIFAEMATRSGARPYTGKIGKAEDTDGVDMAYRVIADHIRTLTFAISDGGCPSNDGRGYVLRRILRRAVRYAHEKLKAPAGFFASLVDVVVARFGEAFPELLKSPETVKEILLEEELQFRKTLERGIIQFNKFAKTAVNGVLSGPDTWRLYDTYGFPVDLTRLMAEEAGLRIDESGFLAAQAQAKEISRGGKGDGAADADPVKRVIIDVHLQDALKQQSIPITDDTPKYTAPVLEDARIVAMIIDGQAQATSGYSFGQENQYFGLLLDRTNFYAEAGGQLYDVGSIAIDGQADFCVEAVQAYAGYVLHVGFLKFGSLAIGDAVVAAYDEIRRRPLRSNHTATHILNHAIGRVLSEQHPDQEGSLVAPDRLRFDFNSIKAPTDAQIGQMEAIVHDFVSRNYAVCTKILPLSQAMSLPGVKAEFGENYPDPCRVVCVGASLDDVLANPEDARWAEVTIELCGGTHVKRTGDIRLFKILSEGAISKGIRRIVAVTGDEAAAALRQEGELSARVDALDSNEQVSVGRDEQLKVLCRAVDEAPISLLVKGQLRERLAGIRQRIAEADKAVRAAQSKAALEAISTIETSVSVVVHRIDVGDNGKALLDALNQLKKESRSGLLYSVDPTSGKILYYSVVADPHQSCLNAADWARTFGDRLAGRSGGKAQAAQGAAPLDNGSNGTDAALTEAEALARQFAMLKLEHL